MMFNAYLPSTYWIDAFSSTVYIINCLPTKVLDGKSPFKIVHSTPPSYSTFRAFVCWVFPYLCDYSENKLAPRSIPCVFIGYSPMYRAIGALILAHLGYMFPDTQDLMKVSSTLWITLNPAHSPALRFAPSLTTHILLYPNQAP